MKARFFSESVQYRAVIDNLEKNDGILRCSVCNKTIKRKTDCHFDHITPFSKGGKSVLENCQLLCVNCNLEKTDKEMHDFALEKKAERFLFGDGNLEYSEDIDETKIKDDIKAKHTKNELEIIITDFVEKNGGIKKKDFSRDKNNLPSFGLVKKYFGGLIQMKEELGIQSGLQNWNRDSIKVAIEGYIKYKGNLLQTDLTSKNNLPSLPCIFSNYEELNNFTDVKVHFGLKPTRKNWDYTSTIKAGKEYIKKTNGKINEKDFISKNNLPTMRVIYRLFGDLAEFQREIGAIVSKRNMYINKEMIHNAVENYFGTNERIVKNTVSFFKDFEYSISVVTDRYGSLNDFYKSFDIYVENSKKAKFSKAEVDRLINNYIGTGEKIPKNSAMLTKLGLPSSDVILRFYNTWQEPFVLYSKLHEKINH